MHTLDPCTPSSAIPVYYLFGVSFSRIYEISVTVIKQRYQQIQYNLIISSITPILSILKFDFSGQVACQEKGWVFVKFFREFENSRTASLEERSSIPKREFENFVNFGSRICEDLVYIKKYTACQISYLKKTNTNLFIKSPNKPITGPLEQGRHRGTCRMKNVDVVCLRTNGQTNGRTDRHLLS